MAVSGRYYRDIAVERVLEAERRDSERILLTLATGTGKTFIAFQIAWKLFQSRWNLSRPRGRCGATHPVPADRNTWPIRRTTRSRRLLTMRWYASQPELTQEGPVPKNGNIFFTIFRRSRSFRRGPVTTRTRLRGKRDAVRRSRLISASIRQTFSISS